MSAYEIGDFVYFFFRETAVEFINCGKVRISLYVRVCVCVGLIVCLFSLLFPLSVCVSLSGCASNRRSEAAEGTRDTVDILLFAVQLCEKHCFIKADCVCNARSLKVVGNSAT